MSADVGDVSSTIKCEHLGHLFYLHHSEDIDGFSIEGLTLRGSGPYEGDAHAALAFDQGGIGEFRRDFRISHTTITNFSVCVLTYTSSSTQASKQTGALSITNSNIMHNGYIAKCSNGTSWNGFWFHDNDAGQNGYNEGLGGIRINGHNINIHSNILEGQRDPIVIGAEGAFASRGVYIRGNYFEANVGEACIKVDGAMHGVDIGSNMYGNVQTVHRVLLKYVRAGAVCNDPYFPYQANKVTPILGTLGSSSDYSLKPDEGAELPLRLADSPRTEYLTPPTGVVDSKYVLPSLASVVPVDPPFPALGSTKVPARLRTLPSNGLDTATASSLSGAAGDYLVVTWTFKQEPGATEQPYVTLSANGVTLEEAPIYFLADIFRDDEWITLMIAKQLSSALTSGASSYMFPYGTGGAGNGRPYWHLPPTFYTVSDINAVRPYVAGYRETDGIPTAAEQWYAGDTVYRKAAPNGAVMHVCTASGAPGTWGTVTAEPPA